MVLRDRFVLRNYFAAFYASVRLIAGYRGHAESRFGRFLRQQYRRYLSFAAQAEGAIGSVRLSGNKRLPPVCYKTTELESGQNCTHTL